MIVGVTELIQVSFLLVQVFLTGDVQQRNGNNFDLFFKP